MRRDLPFRSRVRARKPLARSCVRSRALDVAARGGIRLESVPDFIMDEVLARLAAVLE